MPNAVLKTDKNIFDIKELSVFFQSGSVLLHPVKLEKEAFFLRLYQNTDRIIIKLEKATMPKITSGLKSYMMDFVLRLEKKLNGQIVYHNLNISSETDYSLFDKYEITPKVINQAEYINSLCLYGDISLEIGMGGGEFLTDKASNNKNESFIGVEILNTDFIKALRRFKNAGLDNIKAIFYDVRAVLERFKLNSIKNVYLNFPEPWFKYKKIKHSVLTKKTAKEIENILRPGGIFTILTDNYPFALSSAAIIESSTMLKNGQKYPFEITKENIKTKYEKKWLRYDRTIYKLQYKKNLPSVKERQTTIQPVLKLPEKSVITKDYVFKILNIYSKDDKSIAEVAIGYSKNPQHIFFGLNSDGTLYSIPQSNFVINRDFIIAAALSNRL